MAHPSRGPAHIGEAVEDVNCPGCSGHVQRGEPIYASVHVAWECSSCAHWPT